MQEGLKESHRRLVRESQTLPLSLLGGSKLYKNSFALFNDVFVHIQVQHLLTVYICIATVIYMSTHSNIHVYSYTCLLTVIYMSTHSNIHVYSQ